MKTDPISIYNEVVENVPAYKDFLEKKMGAIPKVDSSIGFKKLPFIDKKSYLMEYPLEQVCTEGTLRGKHIICRSSGSTQEPFYWPQLPAQERDTSMWLYNELEETFNISSTPTFIIVGLILGAYISGELTTWTLRSLAIEKGNITLITPGMDRNEVVDILKKFPRHFQQTLIYGYPPFLKDCIELAKSKGIPVSSFNVKLRLVGETYSERYRDRLNELLGHKKEDISSISSGYASTDFGRVGKETMLCVAIKRLLHERNLSPKILGTEEIPTICQFNPESFYLEVVDGELIITKYQAIPLVRYKTGDLGEIIEFDEMLERFNRENIDAVDFYRQRGGNVETMKTQPFVLVRGRSDGGIVFAAANILVSHIRDIMESASPFKDDFTGNFQMKKSQDKNLDPVFELYLEENEEQKKHDREKLSLILSQELAKRNGEYSMMLGDLKEKALPVITIVEKDYFLNNPKIRYIKKEDNVTAHA